MDAEEAEASSSVVLLSLLGFVGVMICMVNSHMIPVAKNSWSMLTGAVSIFCAVLTNDIVNTLVAKLFELKESDSDTPPDAADICSSALQLFIWWIAVVMVLFLQKGNLLRLKGYGTIGGHILGFAMIQLCGDVIKSEAVKDNHWKMLFIVSVFYLLVVALLFLVTDFVHRSLTKAETQEQDQAWIDQYTDTRTDFVCIGSAFVICLWIRWLIENPSGPAPETDEVTGSHTAGNIWALFVVGAMLLLKSGILIKWRHGNFLRGYSWAGELWDTISSFTAAMCLLWCAHWAFYSWLKTSLLEHVVVALMFSALALVTIFLLSIAIHHGGAVKRILRGIFTGMSLLMGLSWEQVFDISLDRLEGFGGSEGQKQARVLLASIALLVITFPVWMVYMLPRGDAELEADLSKKKNGTPFWAICCTCHWDPFEVPEQADDLSIQLQQS